MKRTGLSVVRGAVGLGLLGLVGAMGATGCNGVESGDEQDTTATTAHYETFKGADGKYYFQLIAKNGERVLDSQAYASLSSAKSGIDSVKTNGSANASYHVQQADSGEYYFNLVAANGKVIGTSEMYSSSSAANGGVTATIAAVASAASAPSAVGSEGFQTFKGADNKYYFHLRAANGEIVLQSQGYSTKSSATSGITAVENAGADASHYEVVAGVNGEFSFRLLSANHKVVAHGEMYASKYNALRGASTVRDILRDVSGAGTPTASDLKTEVETAADGLLFTSESDYPFTYVSGNLPTATAPINEALVRAQFGALVDADPNADKPMSKNFGMNETWESWLGANHQCADVDNDPDSVPMCKKMRNLEEVLGSNLTDIKVFYFGAHGSAGHVDGIGVTVFIVGRTPDGHVAGVKTTAIWT